MIVQLDNLYATLLTSTREEQAWLDSFLSFEDEGTRFYRDRRGRTQTRTPKIQRLYDAIGKRFPAGLMATVYRSGKGAGIKVEVLDKRQKPCERDGSADLSWLHDFQLECVEKIIRRTRGIAWLSTGAGKTEIAVGTALALPTPCLFLSNEKDLLHNAARRWELRTKMSAGRIGDGIWQPGERFTSATFQTIAAAIRRGDPRVTPLLRSTGLVIFDEVHTLPAGSFYGVSLQIPAYYRVGLSGTPLARGDKKSMYSIAATGEIIYRVEPKVLIERGFIAKPSIVLVPYDHGGTVKATTYPGAYSQGVVRSVKRNKLIAELAAKAPKPGLVFVKELKHGRLLMGELKKRGVRAEFVWGNSSTQQRDEAIRKLRWGDLDVIVCSVVFQTGTDIPELESLVIASAGKSNIAALQRVGRGMRVVKDKAGNIIKNTVKVYDVLDRGQKWLANHANARQKSYSGEGYEVIVSKDAAITAALSKKGKR